MDLLDRLLALPSKDSQYNPFGENSEVILQGIEERLSKKKNDPQRIEYIVTRRGRLIGDCRKNLSLEFDSVDQDLI
jgi:hypothetical protein